MNLGATAHVVVDGDWDNHLMAQVVAPTSIVEDVSQDYRSKKALP